MASNSSSIEITSLRKTILDILSAHGGRSLLEEFNAHPMRIVNGKKVAKTISKNKKKAGNSKVVEEEDEEPADVWSVEIGPREGICSFSKPLIIATETLKDGKRLVRIAHFWADVWDITYDPILECLDVGNAWVPLNIFYHHSGLKEFKTDNEKLGIIGFTEEWSDTLVERGYHNTAQAIARRIGARNLDAHL